MSQFLRPVSAHELALFSDRIARSLAERPLVLDAADHRERIAQLLREVGAASFYQLLDIGPAASSERVHEGYERLGRLVHPANAPQLGLEGREGVLEVLFERATAAYITLSHPGRRRDYDRELGPEGWAEGKDSRARAEENRDRARGYYNRAMAFVAKDDFHFAIELLRDAVRMDPQAKYYLQLAELQSKNELWLRHAVESYQRVLELGGPDPQVETALARVFRRMEEIAAGSPIRDRERGAAAAAAQSSGSGDRGGGAGAGGARPGAADSGSAGGGAGGGSGTASPGRSATQAARYEIDGDASWPSPGDPPEK